jgi:uncharacterized protein GlcG (DUF336 family)
LKRRRGVGVSRENIRMTALTLAQADVVVDAALQKGRELKLSPLTVAVLHPGGHLIALKRED